MNRDFPDLLEREAAAKECPLVHQLGPPAERLLHDPPFLHAAGVPPDSKDLSSHLRYVRRQGGQGCWGYSLQAVWDIMNEMSCPYSPNLSMNIPLMLFRTREDGWKRAGGVFAPDGRWMAGTGDSVNEYETFGCTTEGSEINNPSLRWTGNWTEEGVNEADNYRITKRITLPQVSSDEFIKWLAADHPIQLEWGGHVIAIVGYDIPARRFKYVDTLGDRAGDGGFLHFTFDEINNHSAGGDAFDNAFVIEIAKPRPVPAARIHILHTCRMNFHLWLSVEGCPAPKHRIWPPFEWADNSSNLYFTVRLPAELVWPPTIGNRLFLDIYDTGYASETGGKVVEFTAAFGGHVIQCPKLALGNAVFGACSHLRLSIP